MKINGIVTTFVYKTKGVFSSRINKTNGVGLTFGPDGFITQWTVLGDNQLTRRITLPLTNNGTYNCTVDWGDGTSTSTITTYDDVNRIHDYAEGGTYIVKITGDCPGWSFNNAGDRTKISKIVYWGDSTMFSGFEYLQSGFNGCSNLKSLGKGKIHVKNNIASFQSLFSLCSGLTCPIPYGLFDNATSISTNGFAGTFNGCSGLSGTIPSGLFDNNTSVSTSGFNLTFRNCSGLTGPIPAGLFDNNTSVSSSGFRETFSGCSGLSGPIPSGLFDNNTSVSTNGFYRTFYGCLGLTSIPSEIFRTNISCTSFYQTFYGCIVLQIHANTFYNNGEQSTRFNNQSVSFLGCFQRASFSGTQGAAPDLWNCTFGTGTPTKTSCYAGDGNSTTSLNNYNDIPSDWK